MDLTLELARFQLDSATTARTSAEEIVSEIAERVKRSADLTMAQLCMDTFIQVNWTGPTPSNDLLTPWTLLLPFAEDAQKVTALDASVRRQLESDGENVYHLVQYPVYLYLALCISEQVYDTRVKNGTPDFESARLLCQCLTLQQQLLEHPSATLMNRILSLLRFLRSSASSEGEAAARWCLFEGLVYQLHRQDKTAYTLFQEAQQLAGLEWTLTGALGKRTKFQVDDYAQLKITAKSMLAQRHSDGRSTVDDKVVTVPDALALNDDTLLESIAFKDGEETVDLHPLDQCLFLAYCSNIKNTNPDHGITQEQMKPFVDIVLSQPQNFLIHTMALTIRSRLDSVRSRTVERGVLQLQALVDQYDIQDKKEGGADAKERLQYFWMMLVPPRWMMKKELGERMASVGMLRTALALFTELEMWEEVIACYMTMEESDKAETIVRQQLEKTPDSPLLLCILGDLKKDPACWRQAWDVSKGRYSRAMRSLGAWHYRQNEYRQSMECYQSALAINSLFDSSWFSLGCAAMQLEAWDEAQTAFLRCVQLDPANGESWNNLAAVYVKQGRKPDALRCMREGLKEKQENWKMWENFLYLSMDIGEFSESIYACHRLLEIKWLKDKSRLDLEALKVLTNGILNLVRDLSAEMGENQPNFRIVDKLEHLLRVILESDAASIEAYGIVAEFYGKLGRPEKALDARLSAYRQLKQSSVGDDAAYDEQAFIKMAEPLVELVELYREVYHRGNGPDGLYQSRLLLRQLIKQTQDTFGDHNQHEQLRSLLNDIVEEEKTGR